MASDNVAAKSEVDGRQAGITDMTQDAVIDTAEVKKQALSDSQGPKNEPDEEQIDMEYYHSPAIESKISDIQLAWRNKKVNGGSGPIFGRNKRKKCDQMSDAKIGTICDDSEKQLNDDFGTQEMAK
jgi:hypothetical protein